MSSIAVALIALSGSFSDPSTAARSPQEQPTFSARSELVVLHVMVKDRRGAVVTNLPKEAFAVIEDGQPQEIRFFSPADTPATIGLIIDNSTSMMSKRDLAVASALAFTEHSNPDDEIFVLAFNEDVSEVVSKRVIKEANLASIRALLKGGIFARGKTALYDAIAKGLDGLRDGRHTRQVLVVISDGGDNASATTIEQVAARTQSADAAIFAVAMRDSVSRDDNPRVLRRLAESTGGEAFEARTTRDVPEILEHIARDVRAAYTLGYAPANTARDGRLRTLRVVVTPQDGQPVKIRTRTGYLIAREESHER